MHLRSLAMQLMTSFQVAVNTTKMERIKNQNRTYNVDLTVVTKITTNLRKVVEMLLSLLLIKRKITAIKNL